MARYLEHDRSHGFYAVALFAVAARRHRAWHGGYLSRAAGACAGLWRAGVAGMRGVGVHVHRVWSDAALLPQIAVVGAASAARCVVLCERDDRLGGALLERERRAVEGAGAGAGAGGIVGGFFVSPDPIVAVVY
ncbi:protein of unknown function (plasmid) [Caballeronia sp. S22]